MRFISCPILDKRIDSVRVVGFEEIDLFGEVGGGYMTSLSYCCCRTLTSLVLKADRCLLVIFGFDYSLWFDIFNQATFRDVLLALYRAEKRLGALTLHIDYLKVIHAIKPFVNHRLHVNQSKSSLICNVSTVIRTSLTLGSASFVFVAR